MSGIIPDFVYSIYYKDTPFTPAEVKSYFLQKLPPPPTPEVLEIHPRLSAYEELQRKSMQSFLKLFEKHKLTEHQQLIRTGSLGKELTDLVYQHCQAVGEIMERALHEARTPNPIYKSLA